MSDLISRQYALKRFVEDGTWLERQGVTTLTMVEAKQRAVDILESLPSADRPTGKWVEMGKNEDGTHNVKCDQCGNGYKMRGHANSIATRYKYRFCPHCGARMEAKSEI